MSEERGCCAVEISPCFLAEFATRKPKDLDVIGSALSLNCFNPKVILIVEGPMIGSIPDSQGIPVLECMITVLGCGEWEWEFVELKNRYYVNPQGGIKKGGIQ